jgi:pimeloyl-ACP methyl ester carboxylesterase
MSRLFLIPGLGADCRIFKHLDLAGYDVVPINWIKPDETDTLTTYAQKLIDHYHITERSIVIGNSLGGMIGVEIAKIIRLEKLILISSIKTVEEVPWHFYFFRAVPVYKLIPGKVFNSMGALIKLIFGRMSEADAWLFTDMLKNTSPQFIKWAIVAMLKWDNKVVPANVIQISGDKDLVLSYKVKDAITIKGGSHIMIFDRAGEINTILREYLNR